MRIEIVTHCWKYSRLLTYQLSSLFRNPPTTAHLTVTVFFCPREDDATNEVVCKFERLMMKQGKPDFRPIFMTRPELCNRAIGRNIAALNTKADVVLFGDCDYCFLPGFFDRLADFFDLAALTGNAAALPPLFYPREILATTHEAGAKLIAAEPSLTSEVPLAGLITQRFRVAIGGVQFVPGSVLREEVAPGVPRGYLNHRPSWRRPYTDGNWHPNVEDARFRRCLGTPGVRVDLPGLVRIRHATRGGPQLVVDF